MGKRAIKRPTEEAALSRLSTVKIDRYIDKKGLQTINLLKQFPDRRKNDVLFQELLMQMAIEFPKEALKIIPFKSSRIWTEIPMEQELLVKSAPDYAIDQFIARLNKNNCPYTIYKFVL
jgi:hypothetical protein